MRPQVSAVAPHSAAMPIITNWAAMMQAEVNAMPVPESPPSASFWLTSGSIAALAKWNNVMHTAKISRLRSAATTAKPERFSSLRSSVPPRAASLSISSLFTIRIDTIMPTDMMAISTNTPAV